MLAVSLDSGLTTALWGIGDITHLPSSLSTH